MKTRIGAALLGAAIAVGGLTLFANSRKSVNTILDTTATPVMKTGYSTNGTAAQPVDFEKAASAAVPAVVHIKTLTKFKQTAGRQAPEQDPFGGMFGQDDPFRRFFGDG